MISIDQISLEEAAARSNDGRHQNHFRLDSAASASRWDRWSYLPGPASHILQCAWGSHVTTLRSANGIEQTWSNPLAALSWLGDQLNEPVTEGPPFKGGWIGNLSYDAGRLFEAIPSLARDDLRLPLFTFTRHDRVIAIDHAAGIAFDCRVSSSTVHEPLIFPATYAISDDPIQPDISRVQFEDSVRRAIDYVSAGDIFQVNLAQRFTAGLPDLPGHLYRRLHRRFPAWFGAFLDYGDHALLCNSPELFLRITLHDDHRHILTRPIKGTRPRGLGLDSELFNSAKDRAELNMIIDLERNDLGRICKIGSVKVTEPRLIETHPTVYHGAATIEGILHDQARFLDILQATFPGGSVTGAPKIRAMQIIDELEPVRRGPYCGAIGYLSADRHIQFNLAIRTMIARADRVYVSVGGGIVADSVPAAEYDETIVKAKAMFEILGRKNDE